MQENGKLFSFLVIAPLFLTAFEPDRDAMYRTTEKYCAVNSSAKFRELNSVCDADVSLIFPPSSSSSFAAEML